MEQNKKPAKKAAAVDGHHTLKEKFKEAIGHFHLQGYNTSGIIQQIQNTYGRRINYRTVIKYVKESVQAWETDKTDRSRKLSAIELAKIDVLEHKYWLAYEASKKNVRLVRRKLRPLEDGEVQPRKKKNGPIQIPGYAVTEEVREIKQQQGDPRYLQGVQWCIDKRIEIIGLTGADKVSIKDKDKNAPPPEPGKRTIEFTTAAS